MVKAGLGWGRVSGFLAFDQHWEPYALSLKAPLFRVTVSKPLRALFSYALKPIFARQGIKWVAPPLSSGKIFVVALFLLPLLGTLLSFL